MNKRNLIYTGLLMLAMVTSPVSAKETSVSIVHGRQILMRGMRVL